MSNPGIVVLPRPSDMMRRLLDVDNDQYLAERFYPLVLQKAGQSKTPLAVILMLQLAIADYTRGMPAVTANLMNKRVRRFTLALIDDEGMRAEAIRELDLLKL